MVRPVVTQFEVFRLVRWCSMLDQTSNLFRRRLLAYLVLLGKLASERNSQERVKATVNIRRYLNCWAIVWAWQLLSSPPNGPTRAPHCAGTLHDFSALRRCWPERVYELSTKPNTALPLKAFGAVASPHVVVGDQRLYEPYNRRGRARKTQKSGKR